VVLTSWDSGSLSFLGKIPVVAHTNDVALVRIVSAREATQGERNSYEMQEKQSPQPH
jgi:uncharacterized DUF497 family protein